MGGKAVGPDGSPIQEMQVSEASPVVGAFGKAKAVALWLYNHAGDARNKNVILVVLLLMNMFGMIAPETATSLRDAVLGLL